MSRFLTLSLRHMVASVALFFSCAAPTLAAGAPAAGAPAAGAPAAGSPAAEVTLRFALGSGFNPSWTQAAQRFAEEVASESKGEMEVVLRGTVPGESAAEALRLVQSGALEVSIVRTMDMAQFAPFMQIFDLPYLMSNYRTAYRVLDGRIGQQISGMLEQKGVLNLAFWEDDFRQLGNSLRPVTSTEEMEGLKLRTPDTPLFKQWLLGLGAVPVSVASTQLYDELQRRDIDGQDYGAFAMYAAKYYEVQPYYTLTNHVYMPVAVLINEPFYQSLSPAHQRIIRSAAEHARDYQRRLSQEMRLARLAEMKRAGLKVSELSPQALARFRHNARPSYAALNGVVDGQLVEEILKIE